MFHMDFKVIIYKAAPFITTTDSIPGHTKKAPPAAASGGFDGAQFYHVCQGTTVTVTVTARGKLQFTVTVL